MEKILSKFRNENKILLMLAFFSISKGLWENFRQLWLQDNNLNATEISQILGTATFCCVIILIFLAKQLSLYRIKKIISIALISLNVLIISGIDSYTQSATVRIKDVAHVQGVRDNQLVGYGIVVGLQGTGDNSRSTQITNQLMLQNLGTVIEQSNYIQKGSSAAVMVRATGGALAKTGD